MLAPVGTVQEVTLRQLVVPVTRLKVRVCAVRPWSVAVAVKDSRVSSSTAWLPTAASTGAWLVSATVTVISSSSLSAGEPLRSEEHTSELQSHSELVCRLLLENTPAVMVAPVGTVQEGTVPHEVVLFSRVTVTAEVYTLSLHDALPIYSRVSSSTAWLPTAASTGAWLVSATVTVISSSSLSAGEPL